MPPTTAIATTIADTIPAAAATVPKPDSSGVKIPAINWI